MDEAKETLQKFVTHLKLTHSECEDTSNVLQRYIALHVNVVPTRTVYSHISNDYDVLKLSTHSPNVSVYSGDAKDINISTFIYAMKNTFTPSKYAGVFENFKEQIFPRPLGEETWVDVSRKDQWKERAAFLALNFRGRPGFYKMIRVLYPNDNTICGKLQNFDLKQFKQSDVTSSMSQLIKQIKVPQDDMVILSKDKQTEAITSFNDKEEEEVKISKDAIVLTPVTGPTKSWDELRPRMEPYRKRACLNVTFPTKNVAKQMILALLCVDEPIPSVMGKYQKEILPLEGQAEIELAHELLDAFHVKEFDPNESPYLVSVSSSLKTRKWDPRTLLKHAVRVEHYLDMRSCARLAKTHPGGPEKDDTIRGAIEGLY